MLVLDSHMVNIHYHLKCQDITDNGSDNKLWLIKSIEIVVFATEMGHIDNKGWDFEHGVLFLDSLIVNIHYHFKCQEITDKEGDNELWLFQWNQMVVFATEMGKLDDKGLDFMHGFLLLDSQMVNIHYHLKCHYITDNAGDNKLLLIQSIQMVVLATEMGNLHYTKWDFLAMVCCN